MVSPDDAVHFPHFTDKGFSMCGRAMGDGHICSIVVDWVGCADCLLLEGFRDRDAERAAAQDRAVSVLKFLLRQRYLDGLPGGWSPSW